MKRICLISALLLLFVAIELFGCNNAGNKKCSSEGSRVDSLAQYRDTIVGKFNGVDIDTLICEPAGKLINDDMFGEFYTEWRVYTTNNTVDTLMIGNTYRIKFVEEGDLDGNKTEEWGYIPEWNSSLTVYELFTAVDGKWKLMVEPFIIWRDHLETSSLSENDIARPSDKEGFIKIKSSKTIGEDLYWIILDTIVPINPKEYSYELVE